MANNGTERWIQNDVWDDPTNSLRTKQINTSGDGIDPATEDKQDTVISNQTNGTQKTIITDGTDDADVIACNGNKGLVTISPGHVSTTNSTATPLDADDTFTGESEEITNFGIITISVYSNVASAIDGLCVEKSHDGTNWYCSDEYTISAASFKTFSAQADARYFRITYTNGDTDQTTFSLQTLLKPYYVKPSSHRITDAIVGDDDAELVKSVLTGLNPDGIFTNVETTYDNSLKTSIIDGETGTRAEVEPLGAVKTIIPVRLVGTTFSNGTKDTNFWAETVTGSGSVAQAGQILLSTGETADSTAKYYTNANARKITGTANQFRCTAGLTTDPQANNIRRIGAYDTNNGFFFQINGTTMQVVSRDSTTDTAVSNGSFNGNYGTTWTPEVDNLYRLIITYTAGAARFFVDGKLLHTIFNTTDGYTNTLNLPVSIENINSGGNTTNNTFIIQFATILRLGEIATAPKSYYQAGTTAGVVLKYNAGALRGVVISGVANNSVITLYDNTAASGTIIWSSGAMGSQTQPFELDFKSLQFSTGLTLVISGANSNITVIYE